MPAPAAPRPSEKVAEEPEPWRERREGMELEKTLPPELMAQLRFHVGQSLMGGGNIDPDPDKE